MSMIIYFDHHIWVLFVLNFVFVVVVAAACLLLVKRTFREHMSPFVCLFILKMSFSVLFVFCLSGYGV